MTTFFIAGRLLRGEEDLGLDLIIDAFTMQDAVAQAEAFSTGIKIGSFANISYVIETVSTTKTRGREYVKFGGIDEVQAKLGHFINYGGKK